MSSGESAILLPDRAFDDLATIAAATGSLRQVAACHEELRRANTVGGAAAQVALRTDMSVESSEQLIDALLALHSLRRSLKSSTSELLARIDRGIALQAPDGWREAHGSNWQASREALLQLLAEDHPLASLEKAIELAYAGQNLLSRARLVTDVRPVFDEAGETVLRSVVSFVLMLRYHDGALTHRLDLALDKSDVEDLAAACLRGLKKATLLQEHLTRVGWLASVPGEIES
jgi:hypothetical protein